MASIYSIDIDLKDLQAGLRLFNKLDSQLKEINNDLGDAVETLKESASPLDDKLKRVASSLKEGAKGFASSLKGAVSNILIPGLQKGLGIVRTMALTLMGAASAAMFISMGSLEDQQEATESGVSVKQHKRWMHALKNMGLDEKSFSLANLNEALNSFDTGKGESLVKLGLDRNELLGLAEGGNMDKAMLRVMEKITQDFGDMKNIPDEFVNAIQDVTGMNIRTQGNVFKESWLNSFNNELANASRIFTMNNEKMLAANKAINDFKAKLEQVGLELAVKFMPALTNVTNKITEGLIKFSSWLDGPQGEKLSKSLNTLVNLLAKLVGEGINYLIEGINALAGAVTLAIAVFKKIPVIGDYFGSPDKNDEAILNKAREGAKYFFGGTKDIAEERLKALGVVSSEADKKAKFYIEKAKEKAVQNNITIIQQPNGEWVTNDTATQISNRSRR